MMIMAKGLVLLGTAVSIASFVVGCETDTESAATQIAPAVSAQQMSAQLKKYNKSAPFKVTPVPGSSTPPPKKATLEDLVGSTLPWPFHKELPAPATSSTASAPKK